MKVVLGDYLIERGWDASEKRDKYGDWPASCSFSKPAFGGYSAQGALELERMSNKYLVFDLETKRAIPKDGEIVIPDIEYCQGWSDHEGMGISVLVACVVTGPIEKYRVYFEDGIKDFERAMSAVDWIVGYNHLKFDNEVLKALGVTIPSSVRHYDLCLEIKDAAGMPKNNRGFKLDSLLSANFRTRKSGHGGDAPINWQRGKHQEVINYCIDDVTLTKQLFQKILTDGWLYHPYNAGQKISIQSPFDANVEGFVI